MVIKALREFHLEEDLGPTASLHAGFMALLWCPIVNILIFLAYYSYRKYTTLIHGIGASLISAFTLSVTVPLFLIVGTSGTHEIVGLICLSMITIQLILGVTLKIQILTPSRSLNVIRIKWAHRILGILVALLCKTNALIALGPKNELFWPIIIEELVFAGMFIIRSITFPRLGEVTTAKNGKTSSIPTVLSLSQITSQRGAQNRYFAIFANNIYDLQPLIQNHPAGSEVVKSVKNREIDRYLYGMYSSQQLPEVPIHSHTFRALQLVGRPVAKITIQPTYQGFEQQEVDVAIKYLRRINEKSQIYEVVLSKVQGQFRFKGYTDVRQLGRFYSLTLNQHVTRLYTGVNFIREENLQFIEQRYLSVFKPKTQIQRYLTNKPSNRNEISLLLKRYAQGNLTPFLTGPNVRKLVLSSLKGEGLKFADIKPGKIMIVAGGTGLYPFSDLIDLLFKEKLLRDKPTLSNQIISLSPILRNRPFQSFSFSLLGAFSRIEDIHPVTLEQILYLSENADKFEVLLKIKQPFDSLNFYNIKFTRQGFENILSGEILTQKLSKIWICGPPAMNEGISSFITNRFGLKDLYHIV